MGTYILAAFDLNDRNNWPRPGPLDDHIARHTEV